MTEAMDLTRRQSEFFRKLRSHPLGLPAEEWPSALVLRRWMRRSRFRRLLATLQSAMQLQADLHLSAATALAAAGLQKTLVAGVDSETRSQLVTLVSLLRMSHLRAKHVEQLKQHRVVHRKPRPQIVHPAYPPHVARAKLEALKAARLGPPYNPALARNQPTPSNNS